MKHGWSITMSSVLGDRVIRCFSRHDLTWHVFKSVITVNAVERIITFLLCRLWDDWLGFWSVAVAGGCCFMLCVCVCACVCWTIPEVEDRLIPRSQFCHLAWVFTWDRVLAAALHVIATDWLSVMTTQPNTFSLFLHFCTILSQVPCLSEMTKSVFFHVQKTKTCSKMSNVSI